MFAPGALEVIKNRSGWGHREARPSLGMGQGREAGSPRPWTQEGKTVHTGAAPFEEAQGSVGASLASFSVWVARILPKLKP